MLALPLYSPPRLEVRHSVYSLTKKKLAKTSRFEKIQFVKHQVFVKENNRKILSFRKWSLCKTKAMLCMGHAE